MEDMEMDEELLAEFLVESNEGLGDIEQQLLDMETAPDDEEALNCIFRAIHTVKGTCGFLGLARLETLSHAAENLLGKIRSEKFSMTPDIISLLLEAVDAIKSIIAGIEETGAEPDTDNSALIHRLNAATRAVGDLVAAGVEAEAPKLDSDEETGEEDAAASQGIAEQPEAVQAEAVTPEEKSTGETGTKKKSSEEEPAGDEQKPSSEPTKPAPKPKPAKAAAKKPKAKAVAKPVAETTIRVDVDVVDDLMNQVGEMVLTRNRLLQLVTTGVSQDVQRIAHSIDHTTSTLQQQVLRLRMQPVAGLWNRVPRVVRDLSRDLGKKIRVEMEGQETELDRFILAALRDPMTHIIRNSCDHGVGTPKERVAAGKPEEGLIRLTARQESGNIVIEIVDDGKGIDAAAIREKAVSMGAITQETADRMSDHAALQLIFNAGLSMAKTVSKVSGRGVGMDVVRSQIEKAGGNAEIESSVGHGSTLRMRIPLTLAIIPALVANVSDQQFAVPQMNVQELIGVDRNSAEWEEYAGSHFYRLRDKLLPVMSLSSLLHLTPGKRDEFVVVVLNVGSVSFGLAMDEIAGAEEIVVKPLGAHFQNLNIYAGCSILGDGGVVPILDCNGIMAIADLTDSAADAMAENENESRGQFKRNLQHIVLFEQAGARYAIPMSLVQRLETIPGNRVEVSAGREVLQYRSEIIPFKRWGSLIGASAGPGAQSPTSAGQSPTHEVPRMRDAGEGEYEMPCIILSNGSSHLCLEVQRILDVAEVPLEVELDSERSFFLGTAVIDGQATEVIDVYELAKTVAPEWFGMQEKKAEGKWSGQSDLLLMEGSAFFRDLMRPTLESMGYVVWTADDALQARDILDRQTPKVILADLDMENQEGMELVRWVKKQERFEKIPVVALASFEPKRDEDYEVFVGSVLKTETASLRTRLKELLTASEVIR